MISYSESYYAKLFKFEDEEGKVHSVDIEHRTYGKNEKGESVKLDSDIDTTILTNIVQTITDLFCYRKEDFDSQELILQAFLKLPENKKEELIEKLQTELKQ